MADGRTPTDAHARARELAEAGDYVGAQAWATVALADELKTIRQEMHRQARAGARRG